MDRESEELAFANSKIEALTKAWENLDICARIDFFKMLLAGYFVKDDSEESESHRREAIRLLAGSGFLRQNRKFNGLEYDGEPKWIENRLGKLEKGLFANSNYEVFQTFRWFFTIIDARLNDEFLAAIASQVTPDDLASPVSALCARALDVSKVRDNPLHQLYLPVLQVFAPDWFSEAELGSNPQALKAVEYALSRNGRDMPFALPDPGTTPGFTANSIAESVDAMSMEPVKEYEALHAEVMEMLSSLVSGPDSPDYELFVDKAREIRAKSQDLNTHLLELLTKADMTAVSWRGFDEYEAKRVEAIAAIESKAISSEKAKLRELGREWRQALADWIRVQRARGMGDVNRQQVVAAANELADAAGPESGAEFPGGDAATPVAWWSWWQECVANDSGNAILDTLRAIWRLELLADVLENEILIPDLSSTPLQAGAPDFASPGCAAAEDPSLASEPQEHSPRETADSSSGDVASPAISTSSPPVLPDAEERMTEPAESTQSADAASSMAETPEKGRSAVSARLLPQGREAFPGKNDFIDRHSSCVTKKPGLSPWTDTGKNTFREEVKKRLTAELSLAATEPDFRRIVVEHRALLELGAPDIYDTDDLLDALEILRASGRSHGFWRRGRIERLCAAKEGCASLRLGLCLEALHPSEELEGMQGQDISLLVKAANFSTRHLRLVIEKLLLEGNRGRQIEDIRHRIRKSERIDANEARAQLEAKRAELQSVFQQGGKNLKLPHCCAAWTKFQSWLNPIIHQLFPGQGDWNAAEKRPHLQKITERHAHIADQEDVKYKYRRTMDNRARKIQDLAIEVNRLMRMCLESEKNSSHDSEDDVSSLRLAMESLLTDRDAVEPAESLEWRLLYASFAPDLQLPQVKYGREKASDFFTVRDIFDRPGLLAFKPDDAIWPKDPAEEMLWVKSLLGDGKRSPVVACRLSEILSAPPEKSIGSMQELETFLRREGRQELLGSLPRLSEDGQAAFDEWEADLITRADQCYGRLVITRGLLSGLARPETNQIKELIASAEAIPHWREDSPTEDNVDGYPGVAKTAGLFGLSREAVLAFELAWLEEAVVRVDALLRDESARLRDYAQQEKWDDERRNEFLRHLEDKDYARALLVMEGEDIKDDAPSQHRETHWRAEAEIRFSRPEPFLDKIFREQSTDKHLKAAIKLWRVGGGYAELREAFGDWVLSAYPKSKHELPNVFRRPAKKIAEKFGERNPTFLPQLAQFDSLAIVVPETRTSDPNFKQKTLSLLRELKTSEKCLFAILAPGCAPQTRQETLAELRRFEKHVAGIVDDVDFCRLIRRGESAIDPSVGLLEILLEQRRDLQPLSPYKPVEGQNVKVEMYVGRRTQADALATESQYTRLFSGRKLGKSALLKYTQYMCESKPNLLRSGNRLHVVYVLGNKMNNEAEAVKEILQGIERHFAQAVGGSTRVKYKMPALESIEDDPEAASRILDEQLAKFRDDNPRVSLLIVIDEADMFVETQLREYQARKEGCLSFFMGRYLVQHKDSEGLPRIRFLFSGYRVTNTKEGVWRNSGDSLQLDPLDRTDAMQLVNGPFARIGVDMSRHAATIAWRCGYQPAVIMRFGENLLKGRYGHNKEYYQPDISEIEQVLASKEVTQEIHGIVQGNFQGRPELQLVFEAFLVETVNLPSASSWMIGASQIVSDRIVGLDPEGMLVDSFGANKVFELLEELHSRSLLVKERGDRFRLRYPHHLPLLLPREGEEALRKLYQKDIRNIPVNEDDIDWRGCEMLDRRSIDEIQYARRTPCGEHGIRAVVAGGEWLSPWVNPDAGLLRRIGIKGEQFNLYIDSDEAEQKIASPAEPDEPSMLLIGEPALLRWGISRREDVLTFGQRRLSREQTIWWFCHIHLWGLEPKHAEAIYRATAGIPRFMQQVEEICENMADPQGDRSNHEAELALCFEEIMERYEKRAADSVAALAGRKDPVLSARERDLLAIVVMVKKEYDTTGEDFKGDLSCYEPDAFRDLGWLNPPSHVDFDSPEDRNGFALLLELGLLPAKSSPGDIFEVLTLPASDDPVVKYWPKG